MPDDKIAANLSIDDPPTTMLAYGGYVVYEQRKENTSYGCFAGIGGRVFIMTSWVAWRLL